MIQMILISRLIFAMNISQDLKTNLQTCVTWNIKKSDNIDLMKRFTVCKKKFNIKDK